MLLKDTGLNKRQVTAFAKKNIRTTEDLARYVPRAYRDYSTLQNIKYASPEKFGAFSGILTYCDKRLSSRWYLVMRVQQDDGTNFGVMMFTDTYRFKEYAALLHKRVVVYGKPCFDEKYGWQVRYPEGIEDFGDYVPHIKPVYTKIKGISDEVFEKSMKEAVDAQEDPMAPELPGKLGVMPYREALMAVHYPDSRSVLSRGCARLKLNDMMFFAEALGKVNGKGTETTDILFPKHDRMREFIASLPYELTDDQEKVLEAFRSCTETGKRFNALVQGDVGCGKTVVAVAMMVCACENGYQAVLMAPREVLARQHYEEVRKTAERLGFTCEFLSSSCTPSQRKAITERIRTGEADMIVGTHSCIAENVEYHALGLTVTDEEHLFGVRQKELLEGKAEEGINAVSMSATPIPRSLATILYGNKKEIMSIHSMPAGRLPVKTAVQTGHTNIFPFMEKEIAAGHQCYAVCPAIDSNDEYDIVSIEEMERVYREYFDAKGISLGIVNGKMDASAVAEVIDGFAAGDIKILMSTTVIEVGVNVPNATVMVIEQANRFGLASLHQLRGRVGRSGLQSYCILVSPERENARLQTMCRTNDGFEIAEADLKQRGSGDLLGVRQAGNNRFVNMMLRDRGLFNQAVRVIRYCKDNGYENHFEKIYGEYAESVGEDRE